MLVQKTVGAIKVCKALDCERAIGPASRLEPMGMRSFGIKDRIGVAPIPQVPADFVP